MADRVGNTLNRRGMSPETMSVISARNRIFAVPSWEDGDTQHQIGVVANFNPSEGRTVEPVRAMGYGDRIIELVPGLTDPMTISVTRTAQYLSMLMQVFGYKGGIDGLCRSLRHHKYPFDIRQELIIGALASGEITATGEGTGVSAETMGISPAVTTGGTGQETSIGPNSTPVDLKALVTVYMGCWISDWSTTFSADTALVQEDVTTNVTEVLADEGSILDDTSENVFAPGAVSAILGTSNG